MDKRFMKPADLSRLRLFDNVPLDSIEQSLDACAFQELATGEILIAAGQPNENVYLLLFGRLHVYLETPTGDPVATIEPGESVGELSVMDEQPTSAL
ncbi:MAG: cyclic nucleotide-binding domain-containing protein, partial [Acidiferrobacterales bacterium]